MNGRGQVGRGQGLWKRSQDVRKLIRVYLEMAKTQDGVILGIMKVR